MSQTTRRRKKSSRKASADPGAQRPKEIAGLLMAALGVLLGLALATYSRADAALARDSRWIDALLPGTGNPDNWLGTVGAKLAEALVAGFLGYPMIGACVLLVVWGYVLFRSKPVIYLPLMTGYSIAGIILAAVFFGWFAESADTTLALWSGHVGLGIADWLSSAFGAVGSFILLVVLIAALGLLVVDRDIQLTMDRFEAGLGRLGGATAEQWEAAREAHRDRVAARAERRAEREAARAEERERRREERERKREERASREPAAPKVAPPKRPAAQPAPAVARTPDPADRPTLPRPTAEPVPVSDFESDPLVDELVDRHAGRLGGAPASPPAAPPSSDGAPNDAPDEPAFRVQTAVEEKTGDLAERQRRQPNPADFVFSFPALDVLDEADPTAVPDLSEIEENKQALVDKLETYNVQIVEIEAVVGPTVTRYEMTPADGVRISRITALEDDLAMAMAASAIRIQAPIPGKRAIGVEIPNRRRELVRQRTVLGTERFTKSEAALPIALGKNIQGEVHVEDLSKMPHLLIAGATGSGKSVGVNAMITGLLFACHPADLKFVMIDPKKIELGPYQQLLNHYIAMPEDAEEPVITDFRDAAGVLRSCEREMEQRYDLLAAAGVRSIREYNERVRDGRLSAEDDHRHLPYIVVIVDELADLMMTSGKEVEPPIARLAQMARAVGIHLVLATQRPSVDVITGLIKANFPSRIAFQVASKIDSRTILDQGGAEQLVGNGDMLYMNGSRIVRLQGPYISNDEIERLVTHVAAQQGAGPYMLPPLDLEGDAPGLLDSDDDRDDLFTDAARVIVRSQQGSVSLLQRKLSIGYTRAARIVDQLEDAGIVGSFEGSKARQVLVSSESELDAMLSGDDE